MRNFCEYLVQTNAISTAQLVQAMMKQLELTPGLCQLIADSAALDEAEMHQVFSRQFASGGTFRSACEDLGLWTDKVEKAVRHQLEEKRPGIYEILLREGFIEVSDLTRNLDEFIGNCVADPDYLQKGAPPPPSAEPEPDPSEPEPDPTHAHANASTDEPEQPQEETRPQEQAADTSPPPDWQPDLEKKDKTVINEYLNLLSKDRRITITNLVKELGAGSVDAAAGGAALSDELETILAGSKFSGLTLSRKLLEILVRFNETLDPLPENFVEFNLKIINEIWMIRVFLELSQSESGYWKGAGKAALFHTLVTAGGGSIP